MHNVPGVSTYSVPGLSLYGLPETMVCCCPRLCSCSLRRALYLIGLVSFGLGIFLSLLGIFSSSWVYREGGGTLTATDVERFGLWTACSPESFDLCQHIYDVMPEVEGAARGSQALLTLSVLFYIFCFILELSSCCIIRCKNKLNILYDNRVIEYITALAAVVGFLGMLVFAAEVKNKASRAIGQEDMTGGGFSGALAGLLLVVIGCCLLGSGREVSQREEIVIDN